MPELITDCDKEWTFWVELFAQFWPEKVSDELAEMADRMLITFGNTYMRGDGWGFIGC